MVLWTGLLLAVLAAAAPPAGAQGGLEQVFAAEGVRVFHAEGAGPLARATAQLVASKGAEVSAALGLVLPRPVDAYVTSSRSRYEAVVAELSGGAPPGWSMAAAVPARGAIAIHAARLEPLTDRALAPVVAHELAHLALGTIPSRIPRWFNEGLSMWASGQRLTRRQINDLAGKARAERLERFADLERHFPPHAAEADLAYLQSLAAVEELVTLYGEEGLRDHLRALRDGLAFEVGFSRSFQAPVRGFELVFLDALAKRYSIWYGVLSTEGVLSIAGFLVVLAFIRYRIRRRRILTRMDGPLRPEDPPEAKIIPFPASRPPAE